LNGKLLRLDAEYHDKLFNLKAVVTEKIHGENFRVGIDGKGEFIGQKNQHFRNIEDHPNWNKMSDKAKLEINVIHAYIRGMKKNKEYKQKNITFFGELYGKGMQSGFEWDFDDGLRVLWFDIKMNDQYYGNDGKRQLFKTLALETPPVIGIMTIREALKLDIENIKSQASLSDFIEGIVVTPDQMHEWWRFPARLILKYKTKKYSEESQGKHKREKKINDFVSKYVDFVTEARLEHAIQSLNERGVEILYEMKDLQHIPREIIADIEKEENEGQPLAKEDRKYLGSYIPKFYKKYLDDLLKEKMNNG
jgi:hypothetical protein